MLAAEDLANLYVIDGNTRMEIQSVMNQSSLKSIFSMKKVPDYDAQKRPYVLIKDSEYVSLFNTRLMKLLPLVRSKYDIDPLKVHNLFVTNYTDLEKKPMQSPSNQTD